MPGKWVGTADVYEASFGRLCAGAVDATLDAITDTAGVIGSLLDVGTGPGTLARAAAARGFEVSGCDPEPTMVNLASSYEDGIPYRVAGLPDLPYATGSFDAVAANFVVNHTHRPRDAMRELVRITNGVLAVTIWPRARTTLNGLWSGIVRDSGATTPEGIVLPPEDDFQRTEAGLAALLSDSGATEAQTSTLEWDFTITADELWPAVEAGVATIGTTYIAQNAETQQRMRDAYLQRTGELVASDGLLHFDTLALLGVASVR
jgi:SAM-dependent methyltransferase